MAFGKVTRSGRADSGRCTHGHGARYGQINKLIETFKGDVNYVYNVGCSSSRTATPSTTPAKPAWNSPARSAPTSTWSPSNATTVPGTGTTAVTDQSAAR